MASVLPRRAMPDPRDRLPALAASRCLDLPALHPAMGVTPGEQGPVWGLAAGMASKYKHSASQKAGYPGFPLLSVSAQASDADSSSKYGHTVRQ